MNSKRSLILKTLFFQVANGVFIILIGIFILFNPGSTIYGFVVIPFVGIIFCIVGIITIILNVIRAKKFNNDEFLLICNKCNKRYLRKHVSIRICPVCNGRLIDIDGQE